MSINWTDRTAVRLQAGGKSLEGLCLGPTPSQAPTIVMLHEGLGSVAMWKDFPRRVAAATGCGVFVYSRQGYGSSDPADLPLPVDYMTREAVDVLPEVLDAVGLQRGLLFGHGDGASIAALYAGSVSDMRIRGLILMAPHFFTESEGLAEIERVGQSFGDGKLREKLARYHDDPDATFRGWNEAWRNPDFADWNIGDTIDHWRIPVLAIQGTEDAYGTMAQIEEIEQRIYPPLDTLILEGCGHAPHRERADEVLSAVTEFVGRLERMEHEEVRVA